MIRTNHSAKQHIFYLLFFSLIIVINGILFFIFTSDRFSLLKPPRSVDETAKQMAVSCGNGPKSTLCYQEAFINLAKRQDIAYITAVVLQLQRNSFLGNCHLVAHLVGQVEMKKNIKNFNELLQEVNPNLCTGGFIHGVLEEYSRITKINQITPAIVTKVCDAVRTSDPHGINCMHTMGHLIYLNANGDLKKAVATCAIVAPGVEQKSYQCYHGLFMEYTTKLDQLLHGYKFDPHSITDSDVSYMKNVCSSVKDYAAVGCWEELSRLYFLKSNNNVTYAFHECSKIPSDDYRKDCQNYLGMMFISATNDIDGGIRNYCSFYSTNQDTTDCQVSLIQIVLYNTPTAAPSAISFCSSLSTTSQRTCFLTVGNTLALLIPHTEIVKYCKDAPKQFFNTCTLQNV